MQRRTAQVQCSALGLAHLTAHMQHDYGSTAVNSACYWFCKSCHSLPRSAITSVLYPFTWQWLLQVSSGISATKVNAGTPLSHMYTGHPPILDGVLKNCAFICADGLGRTY